MVSLVVGYFVWMLPSLYVDYVRNSDLEAVIAIQEGYMETKSYDNLTVKNPAGTYTVEIPNTGDMLYVTSKFFDVSMNIKDEELKDFLKEFQAFSKNSKNWDETKIEISEQEVTQKFEKIKDKLLGEVWS